MSRLTRDFFARHTLVVARELLGQRLVRVLDGNRMAGVIVETEAYIGEDDKACHAARGKTARNAVMYGAAGHAYIYFIYGMYYCLNVVTGEEGFPAAVLLRALQPAEGGATMALHRAGRPEKEWTSGPGRLCQAMAIDRSLDGVDLTQDSRLFIEMGDKPHSIASSQRIGISADAQACARPWRLFIPDNPFVSRGKTGYRMKKGKEERV